MSADWIKLEALEGGVGRITLLHAQTRNSLSLEMLQLLEQRLEEAVQHPDIRVVVLAAEGPAYSSGHNLKEVHQQLGDHAAQLALFNQCSVVMQKIVSLSLPVIAQVQGIATAAGCQLVASCDLATASESARFATPGVHIGLFCSTPMVALSRVVSPKHAMEMLLTGELINSEQALRFGLINHAYPESELADKTLELAQLIASKSPATLAIGKHAFYQQLAMPLDQAYTFTSQVMADNLDIPDAKEGISAFLEKRSPQWQPKH